MEISLLHPSRAAEPPFDPESCADDLMLPRLCAYLFPQLRGSDGLAYASRLFTQNPETIAYRNGLVGAIYEDEQLAETFSQLYDHIAAIRAADAVYTENASADSAADGMLNGLRNMLIGVEHLTKGRGSNTVADYVDMSYFYARRLRSAMARLHSLKNYTDALLLLRRALKDAPPCAALDALREWTKRVCREADIDNLKKKLDGIAEHWHDPRAFTLRAVLSLTGETSGLELLTIRSEPLTEEGLLSPSASESSDGATSLFNYARSATSTPLQEAFVDAAGRALHRNVSRLSSALRGLETPGRESLKALGDELPFCIAAASIKKRLDAAGFPLSKPTIAADGLRAEGAYTLEMALSSGRSTVPNDVDIRGSGDFSLITGANSSGKTSFLVMAGQLQFLFQLGFWLPCLSAQAAPADGIYTLFSSGEDDTASESRMALEAIRLSSLEKLITAKSLVLFNEPMTSTGAAEGVSICVSLLSSLAEKGARGMMVTHLGEIFQLTNSRLEAIGTNRRLRSLTSEIIPDADTVTYTYKIREALPGRTSHSDAITSRYGVTLEQMLSALAARGLPVSPDNPAWNGLKGGFTHE